MLKIENNSVAIHDCTLREAAEEAEVTVAVIKAAVEAEELRLQPSGNVEGPGFIVWASNRQHQRELEKESKRFGARLKRDQIRAARWTIAEDIKESFAGLLEEVVDRRFNEWEAGFKRQHAAQRAKDRRERQKVRT